MSGFRHYVFLGFFTFFSVVLNAQVNLQNGLVAYYPFNGNVNDLSGNNHNGTIVNSVDFSTDRFGNPNSAAKFEGNDNYISVADNGVFSTPQISISLWFKTDSDGLQNLIGKRKFEDDGTQSGGAQYQFFINYSPYPGIGSNLVGNDNSCSSVTTSSYINTVTPICKERWYHAVITFDGSHHKIYINGVLKRDDLTSFSGFLSCSSELRFGVWWSGGTLSYKGLMDDIRWYNRPLNQNEVLALYDDFKVSSQLDFTYEQNPCSPKTFQFFSTNLNADTYTWSFGNGTSASNVANPSVDYNLYGAYPVQLIVNTSLGCFDTANKVISVNVVKSNKIFTSDTTICSGNTIKLSTDSGYNFCWLPNSSIANTDIANTNVAPAVNTTYTFTSQAPSASSLVLNGNFSSGNTNFLSAYPFSAVNTNNMYGHYSVTNNPKNWNSSANSCTDHTSSGGNMLVVNTNKKDDVIWKQSVKVSANTNYVFNVWIESLSPVNNGLLQLSINTNPVGEVFSSGLVICNWKQFFVSWNSGNSDSVSLGILQKNMTQGSLIAIDDIAFSEVSMQRDSIKISVSPPPNVLTIPDTAICKGRSVTLNTSGGTVYMWNQVAGLSDNAVANPVATPDVTSRYIVSAYNVPGCVGSDTVNVTVLPSPVVTITNDTTICSGNALQLFATGGSSYVWSPSAGLNSTSIANPVSSPAGSTTYYVSVALANGCKNRDSVQVQVTEKPTVSTIDDVSACLNSPVTLSSTVSGSATVVWTPSAGLSNANITSPVAQPSGTTKYIITAGASGCSAKDSVVVSVLPRPTVMVTQDSSICSGSSIQLNASGGANYQWSPSSGLNADAISNPIATPDSSIRYFVKVSGSNGCSSTDSVAIFVAKKPVVNALQDTAVCKGTAVILNTSPIAGQSYSWSPGNGLSDSTIANPAATPAATTDYIITASTASDCVAKDTVRLTVLEVPVVEVSNDTTVCTGQNVQLNAAGGVNYTWSPATGLSNNSISNPVASADNSTAYKVVVAGNNGCTATDSVSIAVRTKGNFRVQPAAASVCPADTLLLIASGGDTYEWLPPGTVFTPTLAATYVNPSVATEYRVHIYDSICRVNDTLLASVLLKPVPDISVKKSNDIDCFFASAQLTASGGNIYSWSPSTGLSAANVSNPVAAPVTTTIYRVKATNTAGCSNVDTVKVLVSFAANINGYEIPNAFTPNGDGKNDCFGIKKWGVINKLEFAIYNRWGNRVFYTTNPSECWDGTYKSAAQPTGGFVYYIKAKTVCGGDVERKGTFLLIR